MGWHTDMVKLGKNNQASVLCGDPPSQSATDCGTSGHPGYLHTNGSLCALQVLEDTEDPIWEIR